MCCREEADEYIDIGALNGIFVLGRSMGFIGELVVVAVIKNLVWFGSPPTPNGSAVGPYSTRKTSHDLHCCS